MPLFVPDSLAKHRDVQCFGNFVRIQQGPVCHVHLSVIPLFRLGIRMIRRTGARSPDTHACTSRAIGLRGGMPIPLEPPDSEGSLAGEV